MIPPHGNSGLDRNSQRMHVFLFDIDGTLINTGGAGGAALLEAFGELFAVDAPRGVQRQEVSIGSVFPPRLSASIRCPWSRCCHRQRFATPRSNFPVGAVEANVMRFSAGEGGWRAWARK